MSIVEYIGFAFYAVILAVLIMPALGFSGLLVLAILMNCRGV